MSKSNIEFLRHALDEIEFLEKEREHTTEEKFMYVDWKSYTGLRDKLIHHYFGVDYAIVWDVVINELPDLKQKLLSVLQQETEQ